MLVDVTILVGVVIQGYDNRDLLAVNSQSLSGMVGSDPMTYVTCCHVTL